VAITGRFDLGTEHGQAASRNVKGRRVGALSIGYVIRNSTKTAAGNGPIDLELIGVPIVAWGANDRALCTPRQVNSPSGSHGPTGVSRSR
jgi:hypothetical protein